MDVFDVLKAIGMFTGFLSNAMNVIEKLLQLFRKTKKNNDRTNPRK